MQNVEMQKLYYYIFFLYEHVIVRIHSIVVAHYLRAYLLLTLKIISLPYYCQFLPNR